MVLLSLSQNVWHGAWLTGEEHTGCSHCLAAVPFEHRHITWMCARAPPQVCWGDF